jgi:hypothetical protein
VLPELLEILVLLEQTQLSLDQLVLLEQILPFLDQLVLLEQTQLFRDQPDQPEQILPFLDQLVLLERTQLSKDQPVLLGDLDQLVPLELFLLFLQVLPVPLVRPDS